MVSQLEIKDEKLGELLSLSFNIEKYHTCNEVKYLMIL